MSWLPLASQNEWEGESAVEERKEGKRARARVRKSSIGKEERSEERTAIAVVLGSSEKRKALEIRESRVDPRVGIECNRRERMTVGKARLTNRFKPAWKMN
jgi:hypothetical protein